MENKKLFTKPDNTSSAGLSKIAVDPKFPNQAIDAEVETRVQKRLGNLNVTPNQKDTATTATGSNYNCRGNLPRKLKRLPR